MTLNKLNNSTMDKEEAARLLDKAAIICVTNHAGQRDKVG